MFRDAQQLNRACAVLATGIGCPKAWTDEGPCPADVLTQEYGQLSAGQQVVLQVCFDFYNGSGRAVFADILSKVDKANAKRISSLLAAVHDGDVAVERWINNRVKPIRPLVGAE